MPLFIQIQDSNGVLEDRKIPGEQGEITFGRAADCTIVLPSLLVSELHGVVRHEDGRFELEARGTNPTLVNGRTVPNATPMALTGTDEVYVQGFRMRFGAERDDLAPPEREQEREAFTAALRTLHDNVIHRLEPRSFSPDALDTDQGRAAILRAMRTELHPVALEDPVVHFGTRAALRAAVFDSVVGGLTALSDDETTVFEGYPAVAAHGEARRALVMKLTGELRADDAGSVRGSVRAIRARFDEVFDAIRPQISRELAHYLTRWLLYRETHDLIFGLGPLTDLLRMPDVSEIMVVSRDRIYIEIGGVLEESGKTFVSDAVCERILESILAPINRRLDRSSPMVDARLADGSRVNAVIPPVALRGPCLTIRKFAAEPLGMSHLIRFGTLDERAAAFLRACVCARQNIVVSGGTGTGKTTLLNVLSSAIPAEERIVTIEDTAELQLQQRHVVSLEALPPNIELKGAVTIRDLVRNALRMRPDRIVVGECRGPEALDMLQAMNTGHDGSLTTGHANSPRDMLRRLEVMVLQAADMPVSAIRHQIGAAVDVIVQLSRVPEGGRQVTAITEVIGYDERRGDLVTADIMARGTDGRLRFTGYLPSFIGELTTRGGLELEEVFV